MSTNFPVSIDDTTTMPVVADNVTVVSASHHNNQSDALQAVETKVGTGASTATDGKFLVGNTTAGSSQWRTIAATDVPDISATYAPASKGVTNGDTHDHSGGDGGQIAYASLSGTPTIPTKATGAEIDIGTNDTKFATPKAIEDSSVAFTTDKLSNFAATTSAELAGVISDETGSGKLVFDTSPTLVTPTLGIASATSINKVAITAPANGSTLTIAEAKTLTVSNTLTLTATDGSTLAIGTGGTLGTAAYTASTAYATSTQGTTADNAVPKSLFDANSIIYAKTDDTPLALVVGASTIVGRKSTGDIVALTATETRTILNVTDGATANTKATGAEVDGGIDDVKFVTSKAMEDSDYIKSTGNAATATNIANNTGTTTTVLHGNAVGAPSFGAVVEADITLADNTTNNVSISAHGFTPKLSNVAGQYLNGVGSWSVPGGSGDVLGPATNTADYIPQWNGANSKTLKDGLAVPSGGLAGLTSPVFTTPQINDTTADHQYVYAVSELTGDRNITLPLLTADDTFVFRNHSNIAVKFNYPRGYLVNGKIVPSVVANDLIVALKGLDGNDPSATNPVYIRIGDTIHAITAALSVTCADGTNWFNAGSANFAAKEIDYFVYLGYNATDGVVIGFSRIPYAVEYSYFIPTNTSEKYCAISTITNADGGDDYEVIGRFAATLSAGAGYTWTVPTFTPDNLVQRPTYQTRWLEWLPTYTGFSADPTHTCRYHLDERKVDFMVCGTVAGTSNATTFTLTLPFTPRSLAGAIVWRGTVACVDNGAYLAPLGGYKIPDNNIIMNLYTGAAAGVWTNSGTKYADLNGWYEI